MNPLFMNQPQGPQGDFAVSQNSPDNSMGGTQGYSMQYAQPPGTPLIPLQPQMVPAAQISPGDGIKLPSAQTPDMRPIPLQGGINTLAQKQNPVQALQKQQSADQFTQMAHDYAGTEGAQGLRKYMPGVDWNGVDKSMQDFSNGQTNTVPNLGQIQNIGQVNAIHTAFGGGSYMDIARSMIGKTQGQDADTLGEFFKKSGVGTLNPQATPWCAGWANGVLQAGGVPGTGSLAAKSFLKWGQPIKASEATKGDIVVFGDLTGGRRPGGGHVGFVVGPDPNDPSKIQVLGGDQSHSVMIKSYPISAALGFRRPPSPAEMQQHMDPQQQIPNAHPALQATMQGIAHVESEGAKNPYGVTTPAGKGRTAVGKYQILDSNIPSWSKQALGHSVSVQEFKNNPQIQERVAAHQINSYLKQGYSPNDAASMWFTGRPLSKAGNAKDNTGTTNQQYQQKFNEVYKQAAPHGNVSPNPSPSNLQSDLPRSQLMNSQSPVSGIINSIFSGNI